MPEPAEKYLEIIRHHLGPALHASFLEFANDVQAASKRKPNTKSVTGVTYPVLSFIDTMGRIEAYNPDHIPYRVYKKMRTHPIIAASLMIRRYIMYSFDVIVESDNPKIVTFGEEKYLGAGKQKWRRLLTKIINSSQAYGIFIGEKIFLDPREEPDHQYIYRKIKDLDPDPEYLKILQNADTREYAGIQYYNGSSKKWVYLRPEDTFRYTRDEEFGNLYGVPVTQAAYDPWYFYMLLIQWLARFMRQRATRPLLAWAPAGTTPDKDGVERDNMDILRSVLVNLLDNDTAAIYFDESEKGNMKWGVKELLDGGGQGMSDPFLEVLRYLSLEMGRAILGSERYAFQDPGTGSLASARAYGELGEQLLFGEFEIICAEVTDHHLADLIRLNFGASARARIVPQKPDRDHQVFLRDLVKEVVRTGQFLPALDKLAELVRVPIDEDMETPKELPKKPEVSGKEEKEEEEEEALSFESDAKEKKWWREPVSFENVEVLAKIENTLNRREQEFAKEIGKVIDRQEADILKRMRSILEDRDLRAARGLSLKYKGEYESHWKKYIDSFYEFGLETASEELKIPKMEKWPMEDIQILLGRANIIADTHSQLILKEMKHIIFGKGTMDKTVDALIFEASQWFDRFKEGVLKMAISTESGFALNLGRNRVAKELAK